MEVEKIGSSQVETLGPGENTEQSSFHQTLVPEEW
jgi:hypothetical protein